MTTRVSSHGLDLSGPASKIPAAKGHGGATYYDETNRRLLVFDSDLGLFLPADGQHYLSASAPRLLVDDFRASVINTNWSLNKGNDAQAANFAAVAGDQGYVRGTTGDAGTGTAADAVAIGGQLEYDIADGAITFVARVRMSAVTTMAVYIGLTDVLPGTTLEMPFTLATATFTSNATDAVGFLLDTSATTDTIRCVAVKNDVDATHVDSADAWAAATWKLFKIKINTDGDASFYIDGTLITTISEAVRSGIDLCPVVVAVARTTATRDCDVDLLAAS